MLSPRLSVFAKRRMRASLTHASVLQTECHVPELWKPKRLSNVQKNEWYWSSRLASYTVVEERSRSYSVTSLKSNLDTHGIAQNTTRMVIVGHGAKIRC